MFYSSMIEIKNKNNNIIDYISKTEQYFLSELEYQHNIKKTNPDDLIYLVKTIDKEKTNFFLILVNEMRKGFEDGSFKRGY